jgi:glycosyltransferase involved in cell wall biosynthesis
MERFRARGHEVTVLTSDTMLVDTDESSSPATVTVERTMKLWFDTRTFAPLRPRLSDRIRMERHNQRAVLDAIEAVRPDVASIWSLGYSSWSAARILEDAGVPIVLTLLDDWPVYAYVFDPWTRMFDRRRWARPVGAALGLRTRLPTFRGAVVSMASKAIAESISAKGRWQFADAEIVPAGVDTEEIPIQAPPERPWTWHLVYVGRVVASKGVGTLLRSLAHLPPETKLVVVGHGHEAEIAAMRALAEQVGAAGRVQFGRVSRSELPNRIREADVLVFPSEWQEPFGIVPLEAMACGVPVVATGTGGSGEFLQDGENCLLFSPGDPVALAAAVRRLSADPQLCRRLVQAGTATAERLTMDRYAEELERLHLRAVERSVG